MTNIYLCTDKSHGQHGARHDLTAAICRVQGGGFKIICITRTR